MPDWQTYRLEDFLPVTPEVYWRLLERINETFWPLHLVAIAIGMAALLMALRNRTRTGLLLLAPAWLSSGIIFHFNYYAELNWAAPWFGWAFIVQAGLLPGAFALSNRPRQLHAPGRVQFMIGAAIGVFGIAGYPLISLLAGNGWHQAEIFGIHPDPTAIATLGIALVVPSGKKAWLVFPIPLLWSLIATLTLIPLEAPWALLPLALATVSTLTVIGAEWTTRLIR